METFSALLVLCEGNPPVTGGFPSQRPLTWSFDVYFDLRLNKRLSKQSRRRWFETSLRSLWRHCNESATSITGLELPRMTRMRPGSAICIWMDFWDDFELDQQNMIFIIADARPLWKTVRKPADQVPLYRSRMYLRGKSNHPNDKIRNMG